MYSVVAAIVVLDTESLKSCTRTEALTLRLTVTSCMVNCRTSIATPGCAVPPDSDAEKTTAKKAPFRLTPNSAAPDRLAPALKLSATGSDVTASRTRPMPPSAEALSVLLADALLHVVSVGANTTAPAAAALKSVTGYPQTPDDTHVHTSVPHAYCDTAAAAAMPLRVSARLYTATSYTRCRLRVELASTALSMVGWYPMPTDERKPVPRSTGTTEFVHDVDMTWRPAGPGEVGRCGCSSMVSRKVPPAA